ncbi:MAG: phosphatidate cytidylyltransferase [Fuerstiella sp.]
MPELNSRLVMLLTGVFVALTAGSIVRIVALRKSQVEVRQKRLGSLKVWWLLAVLVTGAVLCGRAGVAVLLAVASGLGLREFLSLPGSAASGRWTRALAFAAVPAQYSLIAAGREAEARFLLPGAGLLAFSVAGLVTGKTDGFLRTTASVYWGVMLLVYALSHAAMLFSLPTDQLPTVGPVGWFLFLLVITEMDDIAQALVGRVIGRHRITPRISPNKTWEGFLGGVLVSLGLALLLSPWLTTFPDITSAQGLGISLASGLVLVSAAFFGDINMSAVKRDAGVKDGSALLPGMGGVIDRVDSLTFTAPAFYYFLLVVL